MPVLSTSIMIRNSTDPVRSRKRQTGGRNEGSDGDGKEEQNEFLLDGLLMLRQMLQRTHGIDECQYQPMHAPPPYFPLTAAIKGRLARVNPLTGQSPLPRLHRHFFHIGQVIVNLVIVALVRDEDMAFAAQAGRMIECTLP